MFRSIKAWAGRGSYSDKKIINNGSRHRYNEQWSNISHHKCGHGSSQPDRRGYKEEIYEKSLLSELEKRGIAARRQAPLEVFYNDEPVGLFIMDILVEEQVVVELKAFEHQLTNDEIAQVVNYLKAGGFAVGLLLNFGRRKLEFRRILPPKNLSTPVQRIGRDNVRKSFKPDPPE